VIPRLATAYNHRHNGLALFRLLGDLQYQGLQASLTFSLESFFPGLSFYPRVVFGSAIISLARWNFEAADLAALQSAETGAQPAALRRFREQHGLPQMVSLGHTDQQLVFDLSCPQEALFFLQCIRGIKKLTLTEYLFPGRAVKTGNEPLSGQFVAFLSHRERNYPESTGLSLPGKTKAPRNFLPGSEWLYVKLYCTPESADRILAKVIAPVLRRHRPLISAWFFIRYFENGHHVRVRLRMAPEKAGVLLAALKKQLQLSGEEPVVRNFQGDIYRREMERYGAAVIADTERFFWAGSELALRFTVLQESEKTTLTNLLLGVFIAYHLVACFMPGSTPMLDFFKLMAARFIKGFGGDKTLKADLDREYRAMKNDIAALLEKQAPDKALAAPFKNMLKKALEIQALTGAYPQDRKQALLADLVHMQLNRTFRIKHRQQELMVYYFLEKHMLSLIARQSKTLQAG
jgi:thiopeptide-type bacteriocin biosynthesis protein